MTDVKYLPNGPIDSIFDFDREACRVRRELNWGLAAFTVVFEPDGQVLLVQLGDYCRDRYQGNPWTIPGGAVEWSEKPSQAAVREVEEESGIRLDPSLLRPAAWFPRPYYESYRGTKGELLLLFAEFGNAGDPRIRPRPPETLGAMFHPFDLQSWLEVPDCGTGSHMLQPLPKHFTYWVNIGHQALLNQFTPPFVHTYENKEEMRVQPWTDKLSEQIPFGPDHLRVQGVKS